MLKARCVCFGKEWMRVTIGVGNKKWCVDVP